MSNYKGARLCRVSLVAAISRPFSLSKHAFPLLPYLLTGGCFLTFKMWDTANRVGPAVHSVFTEH